MLELDGYVYSTVGRGSFISDKLDQNEAEKIKARKDLKQTIDYAYKRGITKEEMLSMVKEVTDGGNGNDCNKKSDEKI